MTFIFSGSLNKFSLVLLQILITSLAIEKCNSGTRFLSTSKITQFPDGFCINVGLFEPVFCFFFSGYILWTIYLIYRSVNCFMLQSQKKLSFKCYRGTLIQTPENLATHYRSAIKLREACSVLLLF